MCRLGPLASYLVELSLTSYLLLEHLPSDLAAAAVLVAQWALGSAGWTPTLAFYTRKGPSDIELAAHRGAFFLYSICCVPSAQVPLQGGCQARLLCLHDC